MRWILVIIDTNNEETECRAVKSGVQGHTVAYRRVKHRLFKLPFGSM